MLSKASRHMQDVILGGQDGLINVLGLSLGVVGATFDPQLIIVSGIAAMFAESISMGAAAYNSSKAAVSSEKKRCVDCGFSKKDVDEVLKSLSSFPKEKLAFIKSQLLSFENGPTPFSKAWKVMLSTMLGSLIPLSPYLLAPYFSLSVQASVIASIILSALALFLAGAFRAKVTVGDWKQSGLEMLMIGALAAIAGFIIGILLKVPA